MVKKIPEYKYLPLEDLPPYQLYKRWQKATGYNDMDKFGTMPRQKLLDDINAANCTTTI